MIASLGSLGYSSTLWTSNTDSNTTGATSSDQNGLTWIHADSKKTYWVSGDKEEDDEPAPPPLPAGARMSRGGYIQESFRKHQFPISHKRYKRKGKHRKYRRIK